MFCKLMLKDKELLSIELDNKVRSVRLVGDPSLLPFGMDDVDVVSVESWLRHRKVPKNRQFANEIISVAGEGQFAFLNVSYGLSLNDAYWVRPEWLEKSWNDVDLYHHPFDEVLSNIAFTGYSHKMRMLSTSPEYTTNGIQKKSWSNRVDGIYLIKGRGMAGLQNLDYSNPDGRSEVFSEYYASQVADLMGIPHVSYDVEMFHHSDGRKELVSVCKLFTSEDVGYVPFSAFAKELNVLSKEETFSWLEDKIGQEALADIMVFDSVVFNQDRHLGNFGMLVENDTKRIIGAAPVFDNGASLFCGLTPKGIENLNDPVYGARSVDNVWDMSFDELGERFLEYRHHAFLRKLATFTFTRHYKYNIREDSLLRIEKFLNSRARVLLDIGNKKVDNNYKMVADGVKKLVSDRKDRDDCLDVSDTTGPGGGRK